MNEFDKLRLKELMSGDNQNYIKLSMVSGNDVEKTCLIQDEENVRKIIRFLDGLVTE